MVTKLVAVEAVFVDGEYKTILLRDPVTGNCYRPKVGWEVTGENLEELFDLAYEVVED